MRLTHSVFTSPGIHSLLRNPSGTKCHRVPYPPAAPSYLRMHPPPPLHLSPLSPHPPHLSPPTPISGPLTEFSGASSSGGSVLSPLSPPPPPHLSISPLTYLPGPFEQLGPAGQSPLLNQLAVDHEGAHLREGELGIPSHMCGAWIRGRGAVGGIVFVPKEGGMNSNKYGEPSHRAPHPSQKYERDEGQRPPPGPEEGEDEVVVSVLRPPQQDGDNDRVDIGGEPECGGGGVRGARV